MKPSTVTTRPASSANKASGLSAVPSVHLPLLHSVGTLIRRAISFRIFNREWTPMNTNGILFFR